MGRSIPVSRIGVLRPFGVLHPFGLFCALGYSALWGFRSLELSLFPWKWDLVEVLCSISTIEATGSHVPYQSSNKARAT